jgi:hypothetical protein
MKKKILGRKQGSPHTQLSDGLPVTNTAQLYKLEYERAL